MGQSALRRHSAMSSDATAAAPSADHLACARCSELLPAKFFTDGELRNGEARRCAMCLRGDRQAAASATSLEAASASSQLPSRPAPPPSLPPVRREPVLMDEFPPLGAHSTFPSQARPPAPSLPDGAAEESVSTEGADGTATWRRRQIWLPKGTESYDVRKWLQRDPGTRNEPPRLLAEKLEVAAPHFASKCCAEKGIWAHVDRTRAGRLSVMSEAKGIPPPTNHAVRHRVRSLSREPESYPRCARRPPRAARRLPRAAAPCDVWSGPDAQGSACDDSRLCGG